MVRVLELARLSSNGVSINALDRDLLSSARLKSPLTQLNSNLTLQRDEYLRIYIFDKTEYYKYKEPVVYTII